MNDTLKKLREESNTDEEFAKNLLKDVFDSLTHAEKRLRYSEYDGGRIPAWEYITYLKRRYDL